MFRVSMLIFLLFKQKTAYEMRISDWSSDVCSSDLRTARIRPRSRRPQPCAQPEKRRGGAVGEIEPALALLYAGARKPRQSLWFRPHDAVAGPARRGAAGHPLWQRRKAGRADLQGRAPHLYDAHGVRRRHRTPQSTSTNAE